MGEPRFVERLPAAICVPLNISITANLLWNDLRQRNNENRSLLSEFFFAFGKTPLTPTPCQPEVIAANDC